MTERSRLEAAVQAVHDPEPTSWYESLHGLLGSPYAPVGSSRGFSNLESILAAQHRQRSAAADVNNNAGEDD